METKTILKSKTLWTNAAIAAGTVIWEGVGGTLDAETVALGSLIANILLRRITKGGVKFF